MKPRRARPADLAAIYSLIAHYAQSGLLLPRSETELRAHLRNFFVLEGAGGVAGCIALEPYGPDLAEIRSLAVRPGAQGRGLGRRLVRFALTVARRRKIARVFALTESPEFFLRQGFELSTRHAVPEKIARDCNTCPKRRRCQLAAVVITLLPAQVVLPVLAPATEAIPAT